MHDGRCHAESTKTEGNLRVEFEILSKSESRVKVATKECPQGGSVSLFLVQR